MAFEPSFRDDFAAILDGGEPITLQRRQSAETIAVPTAWRASATTAEAEPVGGHVAQSDILWQFSWDEANDLPRLGDAILDAAGECFTILSIEQLGANTRLRCTTRNLRIHYQLNDRIDVQQAVWEDPGGGPEIVCWTTVRAAVPARIQPMRLEVDVTAIPPTASETYRILLGEPLAVDANTRFVDPQGNIYQILEFTQADRIDALSAATAIKQPPE